MSYDRNGEVKPSRNQAVELLRVVAAFGIIAFHANAPFHDVAYSGLVVFLALSPLMDAQYNWDRRRSPNQLAKTFLLPWAFWMVVYGAIKIALHKPVLVAGNPVAGILYGTSAHLWFLPFMCIILIVSNLMKGHCRPVWIVWLCSITAALLLFGVMFWRPISLTWPLPLPQWIHALPAVLIGLAIGLRHRVGQLALPALAVVAAALAFAVWMLIPGISIPYGLGFALVILAITIPANKWPGWLYIQPVSECMMGVYLVHIIFLYIFDKLTGSANYLTVLLAFIFSFLSVWCARRMVPASKLVLG